MEFIKIVTTVIFCGLILFELIMTALEIHLVWAIDLRLQIIVFFGTRHRHHNDDNTLHHISVHTNAQKHTQHRHITLPWDNSPSPALKRAHLFRNGTRVAQEYLVNCFLHDANVFAQQETGQNPCTLAHRASQGRVCRETNRTSTEIDIRNRDILEEMRRDGDT